MKASATALLALAVVGGVGYLVYSKRTTATAAPAPTSTTATAQLTPPAKTGGRTERRQAITAGVLGGIGGALQGVLASGALT